MKGCPRGSSGGISRLFTVMSIVITGSIGLRVVVYNVKTGVVVDGCVRRLQVVDPWRSCAGGCLCVHTYSFGMENIKFNIILNLTFDMVGNKPVFDTSVSQLMRYA